MRTMAIQQQQHEVGLYIGIKLPPVESHILSWQYSKSWAHRCILSGVARDFPGGRVVHPEGQNEEENEKSLRKRKKNWSKFEEKVRKVKSEESETIAHPGLWGWLRPCVYRWKVIFPFLAHPGHKNYKYNWNTNWLSTSVNKHDKVGLKSAQIE